MFLYVPQILPKIIMHLDNGGEAAAAGVVLSNYRGSMCTLS